MAPDTLTIRNLCPHTLTITSLERFPLPPAEPQRPTLDNITDFNNLAHNFTGLLNKTPLRHTFPGLLPSLGPDYAKLAVDAQAFHTEQVDIKITGYAKLAGDQSGIKLTKDGKDEILRLTFSTSQGGKWSVDVNPQSKIVSREIVRHAHPTGGEEYTTAAWHIAHSQLTLGWTPPLNKWMATLPASLPLSALSVPGTHNTPTHNVAAPSVRCQTHSTAVQLANGIRFLDIRAQPEQRGDNMWLVHGAFPISLTGGKTFLTTLLNTVYEFLAVNPFEVVMVSLKREGPFELPDETFSKILYDKIIAPNASKWYTGSEIPTLRDCRGKCVLIRRFKLHPDVKNWGIDASSWKYNTPNHTSSGGHIQVQDFCEVLAESNVDQKIEYITSHISRAGAYLHSKNDVGVANYSPPPIHINFLSASNFWNVKCWPEKIAEKVNPAVVEYLVLEHSTESKGADCATGVLVADFVGDKDDWNMVRLCVAINGIVGGRKLQKDAAKLGEAMKALMEKAQKEKAEKEKAEKEKAEKEKKEKEKKEAEAKKKEGEQKK